MKTQDSPDFTEKSLRFLCGLLFGAIVAGVVVFQFDDWNYRVIVGGGIILLCATLALVQGDRFWTGLRDSWWHWW